MQLSGFFDANLIEGEYDRVYLAQHFASYFGSLVANGVFPEPSSGLQVMDLINPIMGVRVLSGRGWINGYWHENIGETELTIEVAHGTLPRIDSIVLRYRRTERDIILAVKKGEPNAIPTPPALTRNEDVFELQLATIYIEAGSIQITQRHITDTRMDKSVCGLVTGLIEQIDTTTLFNQFEAFFKEFKEEHETAIMEWFEHIKDIIDEDVAVHLQLEIEELSEKVDNYVDRVTTFKVNSENKKTVEEVLGDGSKLLTIFENEKKITQEWYSKTGILEKRKETTFSDDGTQITEKRIV